MDTKQFLDRLSTWLPSKGNVLFAVILGAMFWTQGFAENLRSTTTPNSTNTISYQGFVTDSNGNPLTEAVDTTFRIYPNATGGTPLWEEAWTGDNAVQVTNGLFNVMLGSLDTTLVSVIQAQPNLYLGITIHADGTEIAPRTQFAAAFSSIQTLTVPDGSITTEKIADGAITLNKLGVQPYYFSGSFATESEWMADLIFNKNYGRFCEELGLELDRVEVVHRHWNIHEGIGHFYADWYYTGSQFHEDDLHVWGDGETNNVYNVWQYKGGAGCCPERGGWTLETNAIIWCGLASTQ